MHLPLTSGLAVGLVLLTLGALTLREAAAAPAKSTGVLSYTV